MRKNKKTIIRKMKPEDIVEISNWEHQAAESENSTSIKKYLDYENADLADYLTSMGQPADGAQINSLVDLIDYYYISEISKDTYDPIEEEHLAYVMLDETGKIALFSIIDFRDLISHSNPAIIDTIVVRPDQQNKGYATKFLNELFSNPKKFFGWKPDDFSAYFNTDNVAAKKLFERFGFNLSQNENFAAAHSYNPALKQEQNPSTLGDK